MAKYTVLELTDLDARVLRVSKNRRSGMTLEAAFTVDFSGLGKDEEGIAARGARLRDRIKALKFAPGPCALIVPKQNAIVRVAKMPSSDPVELQEMALFEAEKFIPFNVERHIISTGVLRIGDVEGSDVLIAAIDGPVMESAVQIAAAAGFEPMVADVSSVALVRAFSINTEPIDPGSSAMILSLGRAQTDLSILHDGMLTSTRSQIYGIERLTADLKEAMHLDRDITDADLQHLDLQRPDEFLLEGGVTSESQVDSGQTRVGDVVRDWMTKTVRFIRQTFDFASREHQIPASSIVFLTGEGIHLTGLAEALQSALGIRVSWFDPASKLSRAKKSYVEETALSGFAAGIGSILRLAEEEENPEVREERVNLLPPAYIERQEASERQILLMISGTMVLITLILVYLVFDMRSDHRQELLTRYNDYNEEMEDLVDETQEKERKLEIIDTIMSDRAGALLILNEISRYQAMGAKKANGRVTLTEFKYSADEEVSFSGHALTIEDISGFVDYLEKLQQPDGRPVFSAVGIPNNKPRDLSHDRPTVWEFSVTATLGGSEERRRS